MAEEGRELKRPRRAGPGDPAPPSTWDFLAPWCDVLRGQLVLVSGYIRFISERFESRSKLPPAQLYPRVREAIDLLVLVAHIDNKVWHMLITEQCKLVGVAPLGYDYEEDEDANYYSGEEVYEDDSEDD
ncbi:hypothetical protein PHYSODRAFT_261148 [Phytophthora sojae]|uniref:Uncharacterized protein n=1 Tax=Phytophthora sojae (strain P6497) TaxID=1094619 RepID=G4YHV9_PHYSP|nr:hypothetical protein PHYSODRAFT_261148 [Phytophthora sojae]EGZ29686.1 hypothetical protein PHYSODRAFT_261148 [Phytophthora sojae]|eukprot:XP_009516961.1 hypothetical protein PHYSODRAFT_261148 [Phytophthora sojae]